jgi:hypothetical protein
VLAIFFFTFHLFLPSNRTEAHKLSTPQEDGFDNSIAFDELGVTMRFLARAFTDSESGTLTDPNCLMAY